MIRLAKASNREENKNNRPPCQNCLDIFSSGKPLKEQEKILPFIENATDI